MTHVGDDVFVEVLAGADGLASLREAWRDLFQRVGTEPSTSYEWTASIVANHLRPTDRVRFVVLRRGGVVVGMVPVIARAARRGFCHLTPLAEEYNTHGDWLVAEQTPAVADALVEGIHRVGFEWDRYRVSNLLETNAFMPLVVEALRRRGTRHFVRPELPSYYLSLPATHAAYLTARSAKFRNYLKRVEKKVAARATAITVVDDPADLAQLDHQFEMLLAVERASWKQSHGTAISAARSTIEFWRHLCRSALSDGRLHLQVLTIDGRPAAYNLGYICQGQYSYLKTSFGGDDRHLGVSTYLRARLIEDLIRRGVTAVDFPGFPYEWEQQWTDNVRWHSILTVYSGTARSRVLELLERIRQHGRTRTLTHVDPRALMASATPGT